MHIKPNEALLLKKLTGDINKQEIQWLAQKLLSIWDYATAKLLIRLRPKWTSLIIKTIKDFLAYKDHKHCSMKSPVKKTVWNPVPLPQMRVSFGASWSSNWKLTIGIKAGEKLKSTYNHLEENKINFWLSDLDDKDLRMKRAIWEIALHVILRILV